jgi:Glycosyl hydrolases family 2
MTWDVEHAYGWSSRQDSDRNRLRGIQQCKLTVSPAQADVWFRAVVERVTPATEVRGRIMGPRCLFAETVEVVSPLRSVRYREGDEVVLIARTAFPRPGFWDPQTPLLYRVVVELWQDGQRCDVSGFDLGFRMTELRSDIVLVNKKPFILKGMPRLPESMEEAAARRAAGYNLVVAGKGEWNWWVRASPMGFLLLERVTLSTLTPDYIGLVSQQPCFLGFVLDTEVLDRSPSELEGSLRAWQEWGVLIGLELEGEPVPPLPNGLSFLVCPESVLPALCPTPLPKVVLWKPKAGSREPPTRAIQGVLGWVDQ